MNAHTFRLLIVLISLLASDCSRPNIDKPPAGKISCCEDSGAEIVNPDGSGLWLPSAFTPNKDGMNDEYAVFSNSVDNFLLTIYQNNTKVFQSFYPLDRWNGYINGKVAPDGKYQVHVKGKFKNTPFTIQTQVCLITGCDNKDMSGCTTGDQFRDQGLLENSRSQDPYIMGCQ